MSTTHAKPKTVRRKPAAKPASPPAVKAEKNHWHLERDADDIAWLRLDRHDSTTNSLSAAVLDELAGILAQLAAAPPAGLVILSAKPNGFIAGADIKAFTAITDRDAALALITQGQAVIGQLDALAFPTVALIHGFCLGGGLELALACRYRVAADEPATRLGLPEVKLGIHPGFGGTVRLPRVIGPLPALDLMLSGRTVSARAAGKLGMVDRVVAARYLRQAARDLVTRLQPPVHRPGALRRLPAHRLLRPALARILRRRVAAKVAPHHYPAPFALIELWRSHAGDEQAMLAAEAESVAGLLSGYTARNLVRVFLLQERLKAAGKPPAHAALPAVPRVHVIGGGVMGGDIAAWCALQGLPTTVQDTRAEALGKVMARATRLFEKQLKHPRLVQAACDRLMPDLKGDGVRRADVVIEAIFEDTAAKQALFRSVEPRLKPEALLATNTSSIPLEELGTALQHPERLVGLHFFNPVAKMQLVEIVGNAGNQPQVARAAAFTRRINRLPLPVRSAPGFLVNRTLMPYLLEAVTLEGEGVPAALIDKAAVDFGMPMGPIELADTVGLDICLSVANHLAAQLGIGPPARLKALVEAGHLGRKSGRGFYRWNGNRPIKSRTRRGAPAAANLDDRLMLRLLNEAVRCLREGVVADADLLDAGMIFGVGFAPFHGGPVHYANHAGATNLRARLDDLARELGGRFTPDAGWAAFTKGDD